MTARFLGNPKRPVRIADVFSSYGVRAFLLSLLLSSCVFLPFMIMDRGYFLYFGDFNVQQIPFYKLAHEAVRSGNIFWNWHTDLGANFIGSYSFYLLFSPFFWLTLPFPNEFVPYLMGPLLILKTALAATTSFYYIKRFVSDERYALLGGILYAFSGFMSFNIFFNHFHEVVVFFPLLLISLEELVTNGRRGWFALAVAFNCLVNYWFFIGEVVFVVIYFFVRLSCQDWPVNLKKFCVVAFESVIGIMLSAFLLLPSLLAIADNPRVGEEQIISGWLMWIYGFNQRLPAIWASFFFPPELPSQPNLFPDMGANWSSMSAYLPLFSTSGVIAFFSAKRRHFIKRMLIICAAMASVPVFNSAFVLFNISYYARWFYMPVLLMCVATVIMLESGGIEHYMRGIRWTMGITLFIGLAVGLSPVVDKGTHERTYGLAKYPERLWGYFALAVLSITILGLIILHLKDKRCFLPLLTGLAGVTGAGIAIVLICMGQYASYDSDWLIDTAVEGRYKLNLPEGEFARSDVYDSMDNMGMFWGLPSIQAFHSIVPSSIMEFYPALNIKRDVSSKPGTDYTELRTLLSVRWQILDEKKDIEPLADFSLYDKQMGFAIYENDNFLPMGFGYDACYGQETFDLLTGTENSKLMLSAVFLEEDAILRNSDILNVRREVDYFELHATELWEQAAERKAYSCDTFGIDNRGFSATSNLHSETFMFFSVPYCKGWSATVNGQPVLIDKANIGFMALRVPAGEADIRFDYTPPGLLIGIVVTVIGALFFSVYLFVTRRMVWWAPQLDSTASVCRQCDALPELPDFYLGLYGEGAHSEEGGR